MTKEQVLAVLDEMAAAVGDDHSVNICNCDITEARAAIASWPEPGEAVAWCIASELELAQQKGGILFVVSSEPEPCRTVPLYAAPPSLAALLAELRGLARYMVDDEGRWQPYASGACVRWTELAAILSTWTESTQAQNAGSSARYPEAK